MSKPASPYKGRVLKLAKGSHPGWLVVGGDIRLELSSLDNGRYTVVPTWEIEQGLADGSIVCVRMELAGL